MPCAVPSAHDAVSRHLKNDSQSQGETVSSPAAVPEDGGSGVSQLMETTSLSGADPASSLSERPAEPADASLVGSEAMCVPKAQANEPTLTAVSTQAGTLALVHNANLLWEVSLGQQLFALARLDATGDGADNLVACAWDGATFFVDAERQIVRYQFEEPVCAFTGGSYAASEGENVPTLAYLTFSGRLCLYHHIRLGPLALRTLGDALASVGSSKMHGRTTSFTPADGARLTGHDKTGTRAKLLYGARGLGYRGDSSC